MSKGISIDVIRTCASSKQCNREYQQDAVYITPSKRLAANKKTRLLGVVCDGMGGMEDGGAAAETARAMIQSDFQKIEHMEDVNIPQFLDVEIRKIDYQIARYLGGRGKGSGTTIVAVIIECKGMDRHFYWASAGDSRIYLFRHGRIQQLTDDHNYAYHLKQQVAQGRMTEAEAERQPHKEALISFLGIGNISLIGLSRKPIILEKGDKIFLCSDGITKTMSDTQIANILATESVVGKTLAQQLVEKAEHDNTNTQDNTSVVLMEYMEEDSKSGTFR